MTESETQTLANKVGSMFLAIQEQDKEWLARWVVLKKNLDRLEAALAERGERLEDYGWTVSRKGDWRLSTDPAPLDEGPSMAEEAPETSESTRELVSAVTAESSDAPPWDTWSQERI